MSQLCIALAVLVGCATGQPALVNHATPVVELAVHKPAPAPEPEPEAPWWVEPVFPHRTVVTSTSITILDRIAFIKTSAMLDPVSYPLLDAVAESFVGNTSIRLVDVVAYGYGEARGQQQ